MWIPCVGVNIRLVCELEVDEDVAEETGRDGHGPKQARVAGDGVVVRVEWEVVALQRPNSILHN